MLSLFVFNCKDTTSTNYEQDLPGITTAGGKRNQLSRNLIGNLALSVSCVRTTGGGAPVCEGARGGEGRGAGGGEGVTLAS